MKKFLLFSLLLLSLSANAKVRYVMKLASGKTVYKDSVVTIRPHIGGAVEYLTVTIMNKTEKRVVVQWDGVRLGGSQIAFISDDIFQINNPKADEMLMGNGVTTKTLQKRYRTAIPLVDKKKLKKGGRQTIYLSIPLLVDGKEHDIDTEWIVEAVKE